MKDHPAPRRLALCGALIAMVLLTSAGLAQNGVINRGVQKRMNTMATAKTAVETLVNMMAGRARFDRKVARAARNSLITATRAIPKVFKRPHGDRLSRARPDIWLNWDDFEIRAETAQRVARRLRVDRLGPLRKTLPDMINACLNCHRTYRKPR